MSLIIERDSNKFFKHVFELHQWKKLCDAEVIINGEKIPVHSIILAASSEYFEQRFIDDDSKEVLLQNIDSKSAKSIIEYCYSGKILIDRSNWKKILDIANFLIIPEIVEECSRFAEMWMNIENCMDIWQFAIKQQLLTLQDSAFNYVCAYFEKASRTDGFLHLEYRNLVRLLESDLNVISESFVLSSVKRWINEDKPNRANNITKLLENVKLPYIPQTELLEDYKSLCSLEPQCNDMMLEAIQWQTATTKPTNISSNTKPRLPHSALIVIGPNIYNNTKTIEVFDMKTKTWKALPEVNFKATDFGCVLHEGKLIAVGGREGNSPTKMVESYDLKTKTFKTMPSLLKGRWLHNTVKLGKYVYVVGGRATLGEENIISDIERWDFISNDWENVTSFSKVKDMFKAAVLGDEIFLVGGYDKGVALKDTEAYCPETGKWRECGKLNTGRLAFALTSFGGYLYAAGGQNISYLKSVEKYDPIIDQWINFQDFDTPQVWLEIGDCFGSIIIIGGYHPYTLNKSTVQIFDAEKNEWEKVGSIKVGRSNSTILQVPWKLVQEK